MLEVESLHAYYGPSHVLHGVSLQVGEGEILALLGRNGMGKTTLVHGILGLTPVRSGAVRLGGSDIAGRHAEHIARRGVGLVPQGHRVFPSLTVEENLAVARRRRRSGARWSLDEVYERFPLLAERRKQMAGSLSGGQQQLLTVGRALVGDPRLLLLDEPSEGVDPTTTAAIADVLRTLRDEGTAVLLVEQKVHFALDVADRVVIMERGRIVHETDPGSLAVDDEVIGKYLGVAGVH